MTTVPEPRIGEVRRSIDVGHELACFEVTALGWARCRVVGNPRRTESVPPELWAEYEVVKRG